MESFELSEEMKSFKKKIMCDGKLRDEFSNFYARTFEAGGKMWPTAEHYYQAMKFPDDNTASEAFRERLREATSPMECWMLGQQKPEGVRFREDWEEVKVDAMYDANLAKFVSNTALKQSLVGTEGPIECDGGHFWKTWNQTILERIREELRGKAERNEVVLEVRVGVMAAYREAVATGDERAAQAATDWAAKRQLPPPDPTGGQSIQVECRGAELEAWLAPAPFRVDPCRPEVNGQPHYISEAGGHLYLGVKSGSRRAWVLDEDCSPSESTGHAYIAAGEGAGPPLGERTWLYFDSALGRHVERDLVLAS